MCSQAPSVADFGSVESASRPTVFKYLGHGFPPDQSGVPIRAVPAFSALGVPAVLVNQREKLVDISKFVDLNDLLRSPGQPHGAT